MLSSGKGFSKRFLVVQLTIRRNPFRPMEESHVNLKIPNEVSVCVPNNLKLMTPYVLMEQGDWFEDEIRWMRHWLKPGMKVLDIGANYGLFSLSAAKIVGPTGTVWSVEPTPAVLDALRKSIEENGFENVELAPVALSSEKGETTFYVGRNPELNSIDPQTGSEEITVETTTLDDLADDLSITDVDFLKIDAEGQESKILATGDRVFRDQSPLVLCEIMHGNEWNTNLYSEFASAGYRCFTLFPELGILAPIDKIEDIDPKSLNVFFCKEDRAESLEQQGLLARKLNSFTPDDLSFGEFIGKYANHQPYCSDISKALLSSNYAPQSEDAKLHCLAINYYLQSLDTSLSPETRTAAINFALHQIRKALSIRQTFGRIMTYARITIACGRRKLANQALAKLTESVRTGENINLSEPFLCPCPQFDSIDQKNQLNQWLRASVIESLLRRFAYSFYFNPQKSRELIEILMKVGYRTKEMDRRINLLNQVFPPASM